jgi:hypothetical protein
MPRFDSLFGSLRLPGGMAVVLPADLLGMTGKAEVVRVVLSEVRSSLVGAASAHGWKGTLSRSAAMLIKLQRVNSFRLNSLPLATPADVDSLASGIHITCETQSARLGASAACGAI